MNPLKKCIEKSDGNLYVVMGLKGLTMLSIKLKVEERQEEPWSDTCTPVN